METNLRQPSGLSFIELLIVLLIIGVLAAVLFPIFSSARQRAEGKTCVSNLQQIDHALALYTADYDGSYPLITAGTFVGSIGTDNALLWCDQLTSYLHNNDFPSCPSRDLPAGLSRTDQEKSEFSGYALNDYLNRVIGTRARNVLVGLQETTLHYSSCTISVSETRAGIYSARRPDVARSQDELSRSFGYVSNPTTHLYPFLELPIGASRHHGGANYAFVDGHVKWLLPSQLSVTPRSDGITPGFGL